MICHLKQGMDMFVPDIADDEVVQLPKSSPYNQLE